MVSRLTRRYGLWIAVIVFVIASAAAVVYLPKLTSTAVCPIVTAAPQDFTEARKIGEGVFEAEKWRREEAEGTAYIGVNWYDDAHAALAHSQYLFYTCGYTRADLDRFVSKDSLKVLLGGYESWMQTATCEKNGVTLHEFDLAYGGKPYESRLWMQPISDTRARSMRLDFEKVDHALLDEYTAQVFPDLMSCQAATEA